MRLFFLFTLMLLSATAFAADPAMSGSIATAGSGAGNMGFLGSFFTIAPNDQSVKLLTMMFGTVGSVLPGEPNALNFMFKSFNEAMLVLNIFVIGYTVIFGLMNTAYEGEFLGKRLNSVWVPIRSVVAIALLIPTKAGYCMLQIFMMWLVVQGVGAADTVWSSAIEAISVQGSSAITPSANTDNQALQGQAQLAVMDVLTGLVCGNSYYQAYHGSKSSNWSPILIITPQAVTYDFNSVVGADCGSISLTIPQDHSSAAYFQYVGLRQTLGQIMGPLNNTAKEYVRNCGANFPGAGQTCFVGDPFSTGVNQMVAAMTNAEADYIGSLENDTPALSCNPNNQQSLGCAMQNGWAYAGAFYRVISNQNDTVGIAFFWSLVNVDQPYLGNTTSNIFNKYSAGAFTNYTQSNTSLMANPMLTAVTTLSAGTSAASDFGSSMGAPFNAIFNWIVQAFVQMLTGGKGNFIDGQFMASGTDPVQGVQHFGERVINIMELIWFIMIIVIFIGAAVSLACSGLNPVSGVGYVLLKFGGFFLLFFGLFFAIGLVMAVYIPLIPFIIFFFGVIGWLIAVIETMLAAPMVAIGIAYPEGHDIMGRADPALMLITGVFIRPALMIFGLISGMILASVGLTLLNATYQFAIVSLSNVNGSSTSGAHTMNYGIGPFQLISYMIIYVTIVIVLISRCFSLIHVLPDAVLRWIGGHTQFGAYAEGEEKVSGQSRGGMGETAGGGQSLSGGLSKGAGGMKGGAQKAFGGGSGGGNSNVSDALQSGQDSGGGDADEGSGEAGGGDEGGDGEGEGGEDMGGDDMGGSDIPPEI